MSDITREHHNSDHNARPQPARETWARKLGMTRGEWTHVAKLYTHPLLKHTDKHPHFKHITHRRLGTRNRFDTATTTRCRLCGKHRENSTHLARCPSTQQIFQTIEAVTGYTPEKKRSTVQKIKVKDRLFAYPNPNTTTPDSLKALYLIAWRYIIGDFYRVEFDNYTFHQVPVIEKTLSRFTILARGLVPPDRPSTARTNKASQGRKPKLKSPRELCAPVFTINDKDTLSLGTNLSAVAQALRIAERLA